VFTWAIMLLLVDMKICIEIAMFVVNFQNCSAIAKRRPCKLSLGAPIDFLYEKNTFYIWLLVIEFLKL
jgi:hypothetical protein